MTTFSKAYRAVVNDWSCVSFNWRIRGCWCNHMNPASLKTRPSLVQPATAAGSSRTMKIINWSFAKFCPAARNSVDNSVAAKFTPTFTFLAKITFAQFSLLSLSDSQPPELCIWRVRVCVRWRIASCRSFHGMAGKVQRKCKNNSERSHQEVMGKNTFKNEAAVLCRMCNNCSSK